MKKKVLISVTNDLVSDNRIAKTADVLFDMGFEVVMIGRKRRKSPPMPERKYKTKRMKLIFEKGPLFYAEYNIRLFLFLCFNRFDLLVSNDLDTLLPNYLIHKIKRTNLVYDSHEYYTETPELTGRKTVQNIWKFIERKTVPNLKHLITVSNGISDLFYQKYNVKFEVVRNIPQPIIVDKIKSRKELDLPESTPILLLQGAGINIDRGAEELVQAMPKIDALLLIIGSGDVIPKLKNMVSDMKLEDKIWFIDRMTKEELYSYTKNATIGLSIDKDTNVNYRYSLPNKLFDYIYAELPVMASNLAEVSKIVNEYQIGCILPSHSTEDIVYTANKMLSNKEQLGIFAKNCVTAKQSLNWETEKQTLIKIFENFV
ncbi:MAG: glycosyltransferase [Lentimicrobiaceae bacterium]|nr:glycosyltransferase [Lentimicrobiaceae bacterium]